MSVYEVLVIAALVEIYEIFRSQANKKGEGHSENCNFFSAHDLPDGINSLLPTFKIYN